MAMYIFDIETGPLPDDQLFSLVEPFPEFREFDPDSVKCGNLKDQEKIAAKIAEARAAHNGSYQRAKAEYERETRGKAALSALTGRVLAIGIRATNTNESQILEGDETEIVGRFLRGMAGKHSLVGYNIHGFDLPFLVQRAYILGLKVDRSIFLDHGRYWKSQFIDLMQLWCAGGRTTFPKLDTVLKACGLPTKNGDGADFAALYAADKEAAIAYLKNDLEVEYQLAVRMGVI